MCMWVGIRNVCFSTKTLIYCVYGSIVYTIINSHTSMDKVNCRVVLSAVRNYTYDVVGIHIYDVYGTLHTLV